MAEVTAVVVAIELVLAVQEAVTTARANVTTVSQLTLTLGVVARALRKMKALARKPREDDLLPLCNLLREIDACFREFQATNKKMLGRLWHATTFRAAFAAFSTRLLNELSALSFSMQTDQRVDTEAALAALARLRLADEQHDAADLAAGRQPATVYYAASPAPVYATMQGPVYAVAASPPPYPVVVSALPAARAPPNVVPAQLPSASQVVADLITGGEPDRLLSRVLAYAQSAGDDTSGTVAAYRKVPHAPATRGLKTKKIVEMSPAVVGQAVTLEVIASHDCYFYMIEQDSEGSICPLVPYNQDQDVVANRLMAGVARAVPDASMGDVFSIEFCPPAGVEKVFVFATRAPWREWDAMARGGGGGGASLGPALAKGVVARLHNAAPGADRSLAACVHSFELHAAAEAEPQDKA